MKEYKYKINGLKFNVSVGDVVDNEVTVEVNGVPYKVELEKNKSQVKPQKPALSQSGKTPSMAPAKPSAERPAPVKTVASADAVTSPLPGTINAINVKVGDSVKAGDTVCILEAMKMDNDIKTFKAGTVKEIMVSVGDAVQEGASIMIIE